MKNKKFDILQKVISRCEKGLKFLYGEFIMGSYKD